MRKMKKREWLEAQPNGQKRADQKRVSKYPHELIANRDGSICTRVKPNKGHLEREMCNKGKVKLA